MTDIVERLRSFFDQMNNPPSPELPTGANVVLEAADEIERLRKALREIRGGRMGPVSQRIRNLAKEALRHD